MPAYFLECLIAAAGPPRQASSPRLSLLSRAEGRLAALLPPHAATLKPSASHVNCKNLGKAGYFPPCSGSVFLSAQVYARLNQQYAKPSSPTWLLCERRDVHPRGEGGGEHLQQILMCSH